MPFDTIYTLNFYLHHNQLIVKEKDGMGDTILVREEVKQGEQLSMVVYGMGATPLTNNPKY